MAPPVDLFTIRCCSYDTALISQQTISLIPRAARPSLTLYSLFNLLVGYSRAAPSFSL